MSGFLVADAVVNELSKLFIGCTVAQQGAGIPFLVREEAIADFAFCGDTQPVAVVAKRLRDRIDEADPSFSIGKPASSILSSRHC